MVVWFSLLLFFSLLSLGTIYLTLMCILGFFMGTLAKYSCWHFLLGVMAHSLILGSNVFLTYVSIPFWCALYMTPAYLIIFSKILCICSVFWEMYEPFCAGVTMNLKCSWYIGTNINISMNFKIMPVQLSATKRGLQVLLLKFNFSLVELWGNLKSQGLQKCIFDEGKSSEKG